MVEIRRRPADSEGIPERKQTSGLLQAKKGGTTEAMRLSSLCGMIGAYFLLQN